MAIFHFVDTNVCLRDIDRGVFAKDDAKTFG